MLRSCASLEGPAEISVIVLARVEENCDYR
jgi:hypothetical protein